MKEKERGGRRKGERGKREGGGGRREGERKKREERVRRDGGRGGEGVLDAH